MNEGEGFSAFAIYNAIHLHFTSGSYDYFKYNGRTNVSKESFLRRKDKYQFHKLVRRYSLEELKEFYVANFIETEFKWIGDILGEEGESNYKKWKKRKESLSYTYQNDIDFLFDEVDSPGKLLSVQSGNYPRLLTYTMQGNICIETLCILNDIMKFFTMWNEKIDDDIIWPSWKRKCQKYLPFIKYDKVKFKNILKEKIDEKTTN